MTIDVTKIEFLKEKGICLSDEEIKQLEKMIFEKTEAEVMKIFKKSACVYDGTQVAIGLLASLRMNNNLLNNFMEIEKNGGGENCDWVKLSKILIENQLDFYRKLLNSHIFTRTIDFLSGKIFQEESNTKH
jgi:argonaute-like protein implicated in RNA metabolism and viral defense